MAVFVVRRLVVSCLVLLVSTFVIFVLVSHSGDPYGDLRGDASGHLQQRMAHRIAVLHLDEPDPQRYLRWLGGVSGCVVPGIPCDLGQTIRDEDVDSLLGQAAMSTLTLVAAATVLAVVLGITVGIVSALRQYSGFDYSVTFSAFLFFSLPVFWVAVLLKQYLAIDVNNWYRDPRVGPLPALGLSVLSGLFWGSLVAGTRRRRWIVRVAVTGGTFGVLMYLEAVDWFRRPALGPAVVAVLAVGIAVGVTVLAAGLTRRNVLRACLVTAGIGSAVQFLVTGRLQDPAWASTTTVVLLALVAVAVAVAVGSLLGGPDRSAAIRGSVLTAVGTGTLIVVDVLLRSLPGYSSLVGGRIMATFGSETPNLVGTYWQGVLDQITHLALPTLAIMLISFATYSRYSRATMLETMNQDYVRTARAKGLSERTVVMRHAFRNALIPLTTLAAYDLGTIMSGAVITESVFARRGMGTMFLEALDRTDPNPVMGFFLLTAASIVVFGLFADVAYAYLDPRIRVT